MNDTKRRFNLLATKKGRLAAFFTLYMSEGLPQGFTGAALALEFKRMGMNAAALGTFAATLVMPWTWKFIMGPFVDNLHSRKFGPKKQWIVTCQIGMLATLALALFFFPSMDGGVITGLSLFTTLLVIHNVFAATQDVAIDGLACNTLHKDERGLANGLMFAGATVGSTLGGSGVIFMKQYLGFTMASLVVPLLLVGILTVLILFIVEQQLKSETTEVDLTVSDDIADSPYAPPTKVKVVRQSSSDIAVTPSGSLQQTLDEIWKYLVTTLRTFFLTKRGFLGMIIALLPFGGMALSLVVSTVLTPTIGMTDGEIAKLGLFSSIIFVVFCMLGGFVSDKIGRRISLVIFAMGTLVPTIWMGMQLEGAGWQYAPEGDGSGNWPRHESLINAWWIATCVYSVFHGLMYGVRSAFFMDIVNPKISATHFTAYMALINVVTMYTYWWEGKAIDITSAGWGLTYLQIFIIDAIVGSLFILVIPFIKPNKEEQTAAEEEDQGIYDIPPAYPDPQK